ncbi:MAG: ECF transporter S component [Erysipelotrichaceae bacterium]|nr:ECF transporter S component [Erysipelotrichaceae bacterium]
MSNMSRTTRIMVFVALYAALAIVLDFVKDFIPFTSIWANGGSIDISLIPMVFASIHLGVKWGIVTGLIQFVASVAIGATRLYFAPYSPILGFVCDYLIPVVIMGAASFFMKKTDDKTDIIQLEIGIVICMAVRILCQVISGVYCWVDASDIGTAAAWAFSVQYNLSYGIPTLVMLVIVMPILYKAFEKKVDKPL